MSAFTMLGILAFVLLLWGGFLLRQWQQTKRFAAELLRARQEQGELPKSASEDEFVKAYVKAEGPRAGTYLFGCAVFLAVLLVPFMSLVNFIWRIIWRATGYPPVFQTGTLYHTFMMFVLIMGFMIAVLALAMRHYHMTTPPTLKQIIRNMGNDE